MKRILTSVLIVLALALVSYNLWNALTSPRISEKVPYHITKSGRELNGIRAKYNIPLIEEGWIIERYDSSTATWVTPIRPNPEGPNHIMKKLYYKNHHVDIEEDDFHYDPNDSISFRVILKTRYLDNGTAEQFNQRIVTYHWNTQSEPISLELTKHESDSILKNWQEWKRSVK